RLWPGCEHVARQFCDRALGNAAENGAAQSCPAVCSDDGQVDVSLFDELLENLERIALTHDVLDLRICNSEIRLGARQHGFRKLAQLLQTLIDGLTAGLRAFQETWERAFERIDEDEVGRRKCRKGKPQGLCRL